MVRSVHKYRKHYIKASLAKVPDTRSSSHNMTVSRVETVLSPNEFAS